MARGKIWRNPKIDLALLEDARKSLIRKSNDPHDKDDSDWVKVWLKNVETRIARKKKSRAHRRSQRNVGGNRVKRSRSDD
jgi:hypothetical protein